MSYVASSTKHRRRHLCQSYFSQAAEYCQKLNFIQSFIRRPVHVDCIHESQILHISINDRHERRGSRNVRAFLAHFSPTILSANQPYLTRVCVAVTLLSEKQLPFWFGTYALTFF